MLFQETLEDVLLNLSEKVRSNILGAVVIVWIIMNWELVYAFFYFDKELEMTGRINWIKDYYSEKNFVLNLISTVGLAFAVLIITYALKAAGT